MSLMGVVLSVVISIAILLVLIIILKLNTFVALIITSVIAGLFFKHPYRKDNG